jgi:hypothetical protein
LPPNSSPPLIVDGAATENLTGDMSTLENCKPDKRPITVATAGSEKLRSTHVGNFKLNLPSPATKARYIHGMTANLLSVPQLTMHRKHVLYTKSKCYILNKLPKFKTSTIDLIATA